MKILRKIKYTLFILFVICLMLVFYLSVHGLPQTVVRRIEPYLQFSGMALTMDKIKLSVFEGIVATQVKYYKKGEVGEPVLQADRVVLKLEPLAWIRGGSGVSGAVIKNGRVAFAPDEKAGEKIRLDKIYADVLFDHQTCLKVVGFAAELSGLKVSGRGTVVIPAEKAATLEGAVSNAPPQTAGSAEKPPLKIPPWFTTLASNNVVNADVEFFVDPDHLDRLELKANLHGRDTSFSKSALGAWSVNLEVKGRTGKGAFAMSEGEIEGIPVASINGSLQFDEQGILGVSLKSMIGRGARSGPATLKASYNFVSEQFEGRAESDCDIRVFVPLLKSQELKLADIFGDLDFMRSLPAGKIFFKGRLKPDLFCRLWGDVLVDTFTYKGIPNVLVKLGFDADLYETGEKVAICPFLIVRDEGMIHGRFTYDSSGEIVTFSGMSTADPKAAVAMIDQDLAATFTPYTFNGLCQVTAFGTVGCTNSAPNNAEINFNATAVHWKNFDFAPCSFTLNILDRNYRVDDLEGSLYHGHVRGSATIDPAARSTNMCYMLEAEAGNVDFYLLLNALADKRVEGGYEGKCSAAVNLQGYCEDPDNSTMAGRGWVKIEDAALFTVPIFSGLFDIVGKVVPGLGKLAEKNSARADFTIAGKKVHSSNIFIQGNVISLKGSGDIYFDGRLDMKVQISFMNRQNLLGNLVQLVTMPLAKALELHLGGTVSDPQWKSTYWPF